MHNKYAVLLSSLLMACVAVPAQAEGDVNQGHELATEWCARCHDTEPGGAFKQIPPSFASIAVYRSEDQILGRIVIPPLHTGMPEMGYILTPENVSDMVAYIVSLEDAT